MAADLKVVAIHKPSLRDVPAKLRLIAEKIESGEYGDINQATLVIHGKQLDIFGLGDVSGSDVAYMLFSAAMKMANPLVNTSDT